MTLDELKMVFYAMKEAGYNEAFVAFGFEDDDDKFVKFLKAVDKRLNVKLNNEEYTKFLNLCDILVCSKDGWPKHGV